MEGFLPRKLCDRAQRYEQWSYEERTIVFYESPQRVKAVLGELAGRYPDRRVAVARELTKVHEEVIRGSLQEVAAALGDRDIIGEIVVVLEGGSPLAEIDFALVTAALREQFRSGASTRDAVDFVASTLGAAHRDVYRLALDLREGEVP